MTTPRTAIASAVTFLLTDDDLDDDPCMTCHGDGFEECWESHCHGDLHTCSNCRGSGLARDQWYW